MSVSPTQAVIGNRRGWRPSSDTQKGRRKDPLSGSVFAQHLQVAAGGWWGRAVVSTPGKVLSSRAVHKDVHHAFALSLSALADLSIISLGFP